MYRCKHCGNEYSKRKEACPTCGGRAFKAEIPNGYQPRDLPLRTIYKGTKPPPKPLPPARPLGGGIEATFQWWEKALFVALIAIPLGMIIAALFEGWSLRVIP